MKDDPKNLDKEETAKPDVELELDTEIAPDGTVRLFGPGVKKSRDQGPKFEIEITGRERRRR